MIADSYDMKEVEDAFFFEVEGQVSYFDCVQHTQFATVGTSHEAVVTCDVVGDCW